MKLVFLPATDPRDSSYGRPQQEWPVLRRSHPQAEVLLLSFDTMVWYTRSIRADAFDRIREICDGEFSQLVLIGFSKSGCGAMNIALDHPGLFRSVVVFDAPLLNEDINRFGMYRFYPSADQLRPDVPLLRIQNGDSYGSTELILIHGEAFSDEMLAFSDALAERQLPATCLSDVSYPHRWDSGWMGPALQIALGS